MSSNDVITRLRAAVSALGDVDVSGWDDTARNDHLAESSVLFGVVGGAVGRLSVALCEVDAELSRVSDAIRARGFRVVEPIAA